MRYRIVMTRGALVAVALALLLGSSTDDLRVSLRDAASAYYANMPAIARIAGHDTTYDYYERLRDDAGMLDDDFARRVATLDLSLAQQLLSGKFVALSSIRGLAETFVRSSQDSTMQPVAVYVPAGYSGAHPVPLIVLLHGHPQPESQLLAAPFLKGLADATGTILIAPWGHGYYDFRGSVEDVYDALHAAQRAFLIDRRKQFLAGYSMGGFSVFEVAPAHPVQWAAVMSIAGALLGSDAHRVVAMLARTPFYILTGANDTSIPTQFPTSTAAYLAGEGFEVSFYSQSNGTHHLASLLPILTRAWYDMLGSIVRTPPPNLSAVKLPTSIPAVSLKP